MQVKLVSSDKELQKVADTMLQLRSQYDRQTVIRQMQEQRKAGYQIAYVEADGHVLCVAGFVVAVKLAWGRHIYVDDLVTDARYRSNGAGKLLIDWLKSYGKKSRCREIHLDSGVQRFGAHRFYLREGVHISSHHFLLQL